MKFTGLCLKTKCLPAHLSTLDLNSLYDQVHLYKAAVPTYARTLKYITLNCSSRNSHRSNREMDAPPRPARYPPRTARPAHGGAVPRGSTPR